jgi:hypothetical protein
MVTREVECITTIMVKECVNWNNHTNGGGGCWVDMTATVTEVGKGHGNYNNGRSSVVMVEGRCAVGRWKKLGGVQRWIILGGIGWWIKQWRERNLYSKGFHFYNRVTTLFTKCLQYSIMISPTRRPPFLHMILLATHISNPNKLSFIQYSNSGSDFSEGGKVADLQ